ncbi:hypothetical protein BMS3Bbin10_01663 [bacterium BMS3Bbin10]|nr:hypothetical protein BMS3Bbin10_01663 [bacterium BMS3Bbin10]
MCRYRLFDDPAITEKVAAATATGNTLISTVEREVDHWGVSLGSAWSLNPGIMGITRTPRPRTFSLGADK